jgi:membrane-associated protein
MGFEHFFVESIIKVGYGLYFAIIFAESGLFFGFFLPGDSLLFTLGLLASQGQLNLSTLLILGIIGAITGDSVGYAFGRRVGPRLFKREEGLLFKRDNLQKAQEFYEKHGVKTIVLARFTPIIRTFAPIVAGAANMHYPTFLVFNVIGGVAWITSMTVFGYLLGQQIPEGSHYSTLIVILIIIASLIPSIMHVVKSRRPAGT